MQLSAQVLVRLLFFAVGLTTIGFAGTPTPAAAATDPLATEARQLSGRVTDSAGAPLPMVRVSILEAHRTAQTGSDGRYVFTDVPSGTLSVSFSAIGYAPQVREVTLTNDDVVLDVSLRRRPPRRR